MSASEPHADGDVGGDTAERRAVAAFARAVRLSCLAARHPAPAGARADLANLAVAAHLAAREWAEEAVRQATVGGAPAHSPATGAPATGVPARPAL